MASSANTECYKNYRFPDAIISHGVWRLYYHFTLSYRLTKPWRESEYGATRHRFQAERR
jgi:hypothetical protein